MSCRQGVDKLLKYLADLADEKSMLLLQTVLTVAYVAVVGRVWLLKRRGSLLPASAVLPIADQAPETAVGLPPAGDEFVTYVDDGIAALGDYLSEGFAT